MIPYGRQNVTEADIEAVVEVLKSDFLTQGPMVEKFELAVANHVGAEYAIAVNSATSALHIACLSLGLGPGDSLWTSPITFVASANCGLYCGASVDFVDIDPRSYNICPVALESKLVSAEKSNSLPKVLVLVDLCGQSSDIEAIHALSKRYGFKIIEDASHAIGGKYKGQYTGNCRYSDITVFSFHPVKIITTAEGGMALTNCSKLASRMDSLRSHGITRNEEQMTHPSEGPWYYQQVSLGFNYRMTDIQAALGVSQLRRLDQIVSRRHELANRYDDSLRELPVATPWRHPDCYSAFHLYVVRLKTSEIKASRRLVFEKLRELGIGVNVHYIPVHTQPYFKRLGFKPGDFPNAENYYQEAISLPMFPTLLEEDQIRVIDSFRAVLSN